MKDWLATVRASVILDSYSSSPGFLGFFERSSKFRWDLIDAAVDVLHQSLNGCSLVATSLYVPKLECLREDYGLTDSEIQKFIVPLLSADLVRSVDLDALGDDYESTEYQEAFEALALDFRIAHRPAAKDLLAVARAVMFVGGVKGHFFQIYPDSGLIVYPHDDTGFGFIRTSKGPMPAVLEDLARRLTSEFRFVSHVKR